MKTTHLIAALTVLGTTALHASNVTLADPAAGGITYKYTAQLGGNDSAIFSSHVGAWSWEDNSLFGIGDDPVGWTHTSNWVALILDAPSVFTIRLKRDANVPQPISGDPGHLAATSSMFPSFTLWSGWDNDLMPAAVATSLGYDPLTAHDHHTYNNDGLVEWAEDLTGVVGFVNNSTDTFVEATYALPAGQYSLVLGSNAPATDPARQGYRATLTTVPEPGTAAMLLAGLTTLGLRRRRVSLV